MKKILLFKSREICYNSTAYFADEFAKSLQKLGCEVSIANASDYMAYRGKSFDAVIDFNSILPTQKDENDVRFPDLIDAPFYNYILDHPLYHHEVLSLPLKDSNIICLDSNHADYLRKYYKNINKVIVLPLGAVPNPVTTEFESRPYDIIFTGTYTDSAKVINIVREMGEDYTQKFTFYSEELITNPELTLEDALLKSLPHGNPDGRMFASAMHSLFPVDMYVTAYFREKTIEKLLDFGVNIDVWGHNWEHSKFYGNPHFIHHGELEFKDTFSVMQKARFVLNINPWFKAGAHDRVFSAMANGAIALTDHSTYINEHFCNKKDIALYDLADLGQCPDTYINLMSNPASAKEIAANGYNRILTGHTFDHRATTLLDSI